MRIFTSFFILLFTQLSYAAVAADSVKEKGIPSLTNEPVGLGNYLQMFFGLFIVVGLIVGMAWFMRRMGNMSGATTGNLKVLGGVSVGQRERIVLVQAGDTQLLVGVAPGEIRTLHVMDEPIATTQTNTNVSSGFAEKLHAAIKNRGGA
ncbi:MAG: flagellar biosynthetic protein FliO [Gammaproteobacteria bacterium]|nr:flagellar biosynthetic protein FliO [Gammaproteobacteria bacterium]MCW9030781.1 flagellar biosynthetic protein FliO [Gammaproteobacteria bacterium]